MDMALRDLLADLQSNLYGRDFEADVGATWDPGDDDREASVFPRWEIERVNAGGKLALLFGPLAARVGHNIPDHLAHKWPVTYPLGTQVMSKQQLWWGLWAAVEVSKLVRALDNEATARANDERRADGNGEVRAGRVLRHRLYELRKNPELESMVRHLTARSPYDDVPPLNYFTPYPHLFLDREDNTICGDCAQRETAAYLTDPEYIDAGGGFPRAFANIEESDRDIYCDACGEVIVFADEDDDDES